MGEPFIKVSLTKSTVQTLQELEKLLDADIRDQGCTDNDQHVRYFLSTLLGRSERAQSMSDAVAGLNYITRLEAGTNLLEFLAEKGNLGEFWDSAKKELKAIYVQLNDGNLKDAAKQVMKGGKGIKASSAGGHTSAEQQRRRRRPSGRGRGGQPNSGQAEE